MSDTPRTDEEARSGFTINDTTTAVDVDFARELEREINRLETELAKHQDPPEKDWRDERLDQYRQLVGKLAEEKDKGRAWYIAKCWCPFWRTIAFDLKEEHQQKSFLFE